MSSRLETRLPPDFHPVRLVLARHLTNLTPTADCSRSHRPPAPLLRRAARTAGRCSRICGGRCRTGAGTASASPQLSARYFAGSIDRAPAVLEILRLSDGQGTLRMPVTEDRLFQISPNHHGCDLGRHGKCSPRGFLKLLGKRNALQQQCVFSRSWNMARKMLAICTGNFLGLSHEISSLAAVHCIVKISKPLGKTTRQVLPLPLHYNNHR